MNCKLFGGPLDGEAVEIPHEMLLNANGKILFPLRNSDALDLVEGDPEVSSDRKAVYEAIPSEIGDLSFVRYQ